MISSAPNYACYFDVVTIIRLLVGVRPATTILVVQVMQSVGCLSA